MEKPTITKDYIMKGAPKVYSSTVGVGQYIVEKLATLGESVLLVDAVSKKEVRAREILEDTVKVGNYLRAQGVRVGDIVGFCSENRLEYAAPVVAALAVGATCAPLNPLYTPDELKHTMGISQPSIVFCSPFTASKLSDLKRELPFLKTLIVFGEVETDETFTAYKDILKESANINAFLPTAVDSKSLTSVVLCSSGTTGLPKCVELTHFNMMNFIEALHDPNMIGSLGDNEAIIGLIPFFHGYGFAVLLVSMALKIKIVVMSMFNEKVFLESIQNYKVSLLFVVPPLLVFLAKSPLVDEYDLSSIKQIRCGAAPLSKDLQLAVQKRLKVDQIGQGYGMTELSVACVATPPGCKKMGASGYVYPGMECKVIDIETGKPLPPFKEGEICFLGPFIMKGYMKNKKATDETIDNDGWLHTGDIGYYDQDGCLFIVDRLKELIKYKGFQVAPAELEALLLKNPEIKDAAVIGIPDESAGELPFAFIVRQPDSKITAPEIQKFVSDRVSAQKRLTGGLRFVEEIPKNPSGKILRRELRQLYKTTSKL